MLGTLAGALEVRGIVLNEGAIAATVEGVNTVRDRLPVLTEIVVHYALRVPAGQRDKVDRALATHQGKCPTAATIAPAVAIRWTAGITEV